MKTFTKILAVVALLATMAAPVLAEVFEYQGVTQYGYFTNGGQLTIPRGAWVRLVVSDTAPAARVFSGFGVTGNYLGDTGAVVTTATGENASLIMGVAENDILPGRIGAVIQRGYTSAKVNHSDTGGVASWSAGHPLSITGSSNAVTTYGFAGSALYTVGAAATDAATVAATQIVGRVVYTQPTTTVAAFSDTTTLTPVFVTCR